MSLDNEVRLWFGNMKSVLDNLGAFEMAREALAKGKQFYYKYTSPSHSKIYNASTLMDIYNGNNIFDSTDAEYSFLIHNQNSIIGLYNGLRYGSVLNSEGKSFNVTYTSNTYTQNLLSIFSYVTPTSIKVKTYNTKALVTLYNSRSKGAYPINNFIV